MEWIEFIKAAALGVVQGITEWLPISSTGHMILLNEFFTLNMSEDFVTVFLVVVQLGSILAVCLLYFDKLNPFSRRKNYLQKRDTLSLWAKVIVAIIPAGIIGVLFEEDIDRIFFNVPTIAFALIFYGILFIIIERINKRRSFKINGFEKMSYPTAFLIGCFQVLSLIPGTSRSGSTILGASILGTSRPVAAEFSFFLAIPVMFGASILRLVKYGLNFSGFEWGVLLVGSVISFFVSILAIKFLVSYIKKHDFTIFGWYRIVLGILVLLYFFVLK
ncbi:MAG: undecaprenyl-diphosphate phosphatase [Clostridia bacterium]|nr:undecaprenyl-diphosphate phosphatase [Clostridia bacterium]MDD4799102.1 undecaprenyl-diphosphate phosphatase [Clostridia bacterium]